MRTAIVESPTGPGESLRVRGTMDPSLGSALGAPAEEMGPGPCRTWLHTARTLPAPAPGYRLLAVNLGPILDARPLGAKHTRSIQLRTFGLMLVPDAVRIDLPDTPHLLLIEAEAESLCPGASGAAAAMETGDAGGAEAGPRLLSAGPDPLIRSLARSLVEEILGRAEEEPVRTMIAGALVARASRLLAAPGAARQAGTTTRLQDYKIRRVAAYIDSHIAETVTLEQLAEVAGISRYHFSRAFKAATGWTPHQYVLHRRVEHCRALIADTDLDLAEIALNAGFCSQSHLTTAFRQAIGCTPGRYRRACRAKVEGVAAAG